METNCKGKEYYNNRKIKFEGEYLNGRRWNGIGYDYYGNKTFEIKYGNGKCREYNFYGNLLFEGEYFNGKKMEKVKNFLKIINWYLKGNI